MCNNVSETRSNVIDFKAKKEERELRQKNEIEQLEEFLKNQLSPFKMIEIANDNERELMTIDEYVIGQLEILSEVEEVLADDTLTQKEMKTATLKLVEELLQLSLTYMEDTLV